MMRSPIVIEEVEARIERVTVLEDRAQVRRTARLELAGGLHLLRVAKVSPLCVDRTLRGELAGTGRLLDVRIRREHAVLSARPAEDLALHEQIEQMRGQYLERFGRLRVAEAQQKTVRRLISDLLHALCLEAGRGGDRQAAWAASFEQLDLRLRTLEEEIRDARLAADQLAERIEQLGERHQLATQPTSSYTASLEAAVELGATGGALEITWEYLVPCALWRPTHRAELEGSELTWTLGAMIWQHTGEDWLDARISLSTARPALGAELPLLEDDLLRLRGKTEAEAQTLEVETRDDQIALLSPAGGGTQGMVPGVDDGGEVRSFELTERASVPSDGRAHLVELDRFRIPAKLDSVCLPELVPSVMLRSRQPNASKLPMLAGPVTLIRNGGFVGRSLLPFVAPKESFLLGWGSEDEVQVVRRVDRSDSEEVSFGRRTRTRTWNRVFLSNTGSTPRTIVLAERIPVSEIEEVKIRLLEKETTAGHRLDENGHLHWELTLAPGATRELCAVYDLESSKKVYWR